MSDEIKKSILELATAAGIIGRADMEAEPLLGDLYYVELVREATLRLERVVLGYERMRAKLQEVLNDDLS